MVGPGPLWQPDPSLEDQAHTPLPWLLVAELCLPSRWRTVCLNLGLSWDFSSAPCTWLSREEPAPQLGMDTGLTFTSSLPFLNSQLILSGLSCLLSERVVALKRDGRLSVVAELTASRQGAKRRLDISLSTHGNPLRFKLNWR